MQKQHFGACVVFLRTFLVDIHKLYIDLDLQSSLFYCASFVICFQVSGSSLLFSFHDLRFSFLKQKRLNKNSFDVLFPCVQQLVVNSPSLVIQHFCGSGLKFLLIKIQLFQLTSLSFTLLSWDGLKINRIEKIVQRKCNIMPISY